jgi:RNA polymerase sigma-70 factor (ECF subfamily)
MNNTQPISEKSPVSPDKWVDRYGDYLYRYTLVRVRDVASAEDIVQETFLAALNSYKNYQGRSSEKTWLTGILKHKIVDYFRKKTKEALYHDTDTLSFAPEDFFNRKGQWKIKPFKWDADPQKLIEQQEFMKVLHDCLSQLSQRHASAFILREITGEKVKEICKILDITPTNCWVILHRARMYLRRCLEISWFTDETYEESS